MKRWAQREREYNLKKKAGSSSEQEKKVDKITFVPSIMLLEAAARNDLDEV